MIARGIFILLFLVLSSAGFSAQLSLDEAIRRGLTNNRDLSAGALGAEAARGRVEQAGLRPNPSFDAAAQDDLLTGNRGARKFDLGFSQAIPLGGRLREAQAVARVGIGSATADLDNRRRIITGEITKLFVDVLALNQHVALRDQIIGANRRLLEVSRARAQVGEVSTFDVNAAALELAKLEQERAGFVADRLNRVQNLKPLLGAAPDETIEPAGDLDALVTHLADSSDAAPATWNRADLRAAALVIERLDAEQRLARAEVKGDVIVGGTYSFDRGRGGNADNLVGARVSLPLPIRNKNQGRLRELRAERTRAQRDVEALQLTIASEVAAARQRSAQFQKILETYGLAVAPLGEKAERDLAAAYQQGQVPLFQVIQSQQQRLTLATGALEIRAKYAQALADLQTATGRNAQLVNPPALNDQP